MREMAASVLQRGLVLIASLGLAGTLLAVPATTQDDKAEADYAIQAIARTLKRLGEDKVAERLLRDYKAKKPRIDFAPHTDGTNAKTGARYWAVFGENTMTLHISVLGLALRRRALDKDPYAWTSTLVQWAMTVYHEYVHMDQIRPGLKAEFEDPAWRESDAALVRWVDRMVMEYARLAPQPDSPAKRQAMEEIAKILRHLKSEITTLQSGVKGNIADGVMTAGYAWKSPLAMRRVDAIIGMIEKQLPSAASAAKPKRPTPPRSPVAPSGPPARPAWTKAGSTELEPVSSMYRPRDDKWYQFGRPQLSAGGTERSWHWVEPPSGSCQGDVAISSTWTQPPGRLVPGDKLRLTLAVRASASQNCGGQAVQGGVTAHINGGRWDAVGVEGWSNSPIAPVTKTIETVVPGGKSGGTLEIKLCTGYVGCAITRYTFR